MEVQEQDSEDNEHVGIGVRDSNTDLKAQKQWPTKFLQCQRCGGHILSETSTAKRLHNVKCLSSAVGASQGSSFRLGDNDIFQGFRQNHLPLVTIQVKKLSIEDVARVRGALKHEATQKRGRGRLPSEKKKPVKGKGRIITGVARCSEDLYSQGETESSRHSMAKTLFQETEDCITPKSETKDVDTSNFTSVLQGNLSVNGMVKKRRGRPPKAKIISLERGSNGMANSKAISDQQNTSLNNECPPKNRFALTDSERKSNFLHKTVESEVAHKRRAGRPPKNKIVTNSAEESMNDCSKVNSNVSKYFTLSKKRILKRCRRRLPKKNMQQKSSLLKSSVAKSTDDESYENGGTETPNRSNISSTTLQEKTNIKNSSGRPRGTKNRNGLDVTNIIEDSGRARRSCLKANEMFKEIAKGSNCSEDSDSQSEVDELGVPRSKHNKKRKRPGPKKKSNNSSVTDYKRYVKKATCIFCKQYVREFYLQMHVTHFHTEGHNEESCDCELKFCKPLNPSEPKREGIGRKRKYNDDELSVPVYERYMRRTTCAFCNEQVRKFYLDMHVAHFHTEGHDKDNCDCELRFCKPFRANEDIPQPWKENRGRKKKYNDPTVSDYMRYTRRARCKLCKEYVRRFYLQMHVAHFHTEGHNQESCDCELKFCKPLSVNGKLPERKRSCPKCGKSVGAKELPKHLLRHEIKTRIMNPSGEKKVTCIICNNGFASYHSLKSHFVSFHMVTSPFACKISGCSFKTGEYYKLERHVATHIKENRMKCSKCGKCFSCLGTLVFHSSVCGKKRRRNIGITEEHEEIYTINKQYKAADLLTESESPVASKTKRETIVELSSIHLYDKIIETENGPVHVKGEQLQAFPEVNKIEKDILDTNVEGNISIQKDINKNMTTDDTTEIEKIEGDWDEAKIRAIISKKIQSWDDKLQDIGYVNSLIKQDPVFQKLEIDYPEFAGMILRNGGRKNYFMVHKTAPTPAYRCDRCFRAFRRSYALQKHKLQNICHLIGNGKNGGRNTTGNNPALSADKAILIPNKVEIEAADDPLQEDSSMNFTCSGCGFKSFSASDLEKHFKTSPFHKKKKRDKAYKCPKNCGAHYNTMQELNKHIDVIHLKKRDVKCNLCSRAYPSKAHLTKHILYFHELRELFSCTKCGHRFKLKENCEQHEVTCTVEKRRPKCQQCGEHFSCEASLRRHVRIVHMNDVASSAKEKINDFQSSEIALNECSGGTTSDKVVETCAAQPPEKEENSMILGF